jgi:hypothetical protein
MGRYGEAIDLLEAQQAVKVWFHIKTNWSDRSGNGQWARDRARHRFGAGTLTIHRIASTMRAP